MNKTNIKKDLEDYKFWCKSQGTGFDASEYSVFSFYMKTFTLIKEMKDETCLLYLW